jgi:hypothetical protein
MKKENDLTFGMKVAIKLMTFIEWICGGQKKWN